MFTYHLLSLNPRNLAFEDEVLTYSHVLAESEELTCTGMLELYQALLSFHSFLKTYIISLVKYIL